MVTRGGITPRAVFNRNFTPLPPLKLRKSTRHNVTEYRTLGGRVKCEPCQAIASKTGQRCRCPAVRGTTLCANHRPAGRGPLTEYGRRRCALARTKTGNYTREARKRHSQKLLELYELEQLGRRIGLISGGMVGRKSVKR